MAPPPLPTTAAELDPFYGDAPVGVRANMVATLDAAGAFRGRTKAITDPHDQYLLRYLRGLADVVLVGAATVQAENYGPVRLDPETVNTRTAAGRAAVPPLAIVTARAVLPADLRIFDPQAPRPLILTLAEAAKAAASELAGRADLIVVGEERIEVDRVIAALEARQLRRVLCEGGPFLLSRLIEADLVDDMCLTLSPYLAGSQPTTPQPPSARELPTRLRLRHVLSHDDLLYLRYSRP